MPGTARNPSSGEPHEKDADDGTSLKVPTTLTPITSLSRESQEKWAQGTFRYSGLRLEICSFMVHAPRVSPQAPPSHGHYSRGKASFGSPCVPAPSIHLALRRPSLNICTAQNWMCPSPHRCGQGAATKVFPGGDPDSSGLGAPLIGIWNWEQIKSLLASGWNCDVCLCE